MVGFGAAGGRRAFAAGAQRRQHERGARYQAPRGILLLFRCLLRSSPLTTRAYGMLSYVPDHVAAAVRAGDPAARRAVADAAAGRGGAIVQTAMIVPFVRYEVNFQFLSPTAPTRSMTMKPNSCE